MNVKLFFGLLAGFISATYLAVLYQIDKAYLLLGYEKITWAFIFLAVILGLWRDRSLRPDGFISLKDSLSTAFQIFVIAYLVKFAFVYILFYYVDPSLLDMAKETAVKIFTEHRNPDETQEIFEQRLEAFKKTNFGPQLFGLGVMLEIVAGFVLSLGIAAIFRRDRPDY